MCFCDTNQILSRMMLGLSGDNMFDRASLYDSCLIHSFRSSTIIF